MKNKTLKLVTSLILATTLTACGGGSGSGNGGSNGGEKPNQAPVLTVSASNVSMNENTSQQIKLSATDKNNDTISYSATSNNSLVSVNVSGETLTIKANEVETDTEVLVEAIASDGKLNTKKEIRVSVKNIENDINNSKPVLTVSEMDINMDESTSQEVILSTTDKDGDDISYNISSNNEIVSTKLVNNTLTLTAGKVESKTEVKVTIEASDGKDSDVKTINVTINPEGTGENDIPTLTIAGEDKGVITINDNGETELVFIIEDKNDTVHDISITKFNEIEGSLDIIKEYNLTNKNITLKIDSLPENKEQFLLGFTFKVTDGKDSSEREVIFKIVSPESEIPTFEYARSDGNFIYVNQEGETVIEYTVNDDNLEMFSFTKVEHWYGDSNSYEIELNEDNNKIIITSNTLSVKDTFGVSFYWTDNDNYGIENLEFYVMSPISEAELEMQEYINDALKYEASVREYEILGKFYAEVLENTGFITSQQAIDYGFAVETKETQKYALFMQYISIFKVYVLSGDFKDESFRSSYKVVMDNIIKDLTGEGDYATNIINELSEISLGLLPKIDFTTTVNEYDSENKLFSKFKGNTKYGSYNENNDWIFNKEYEFMNAVVEKSLELQKDKFFDISNLIVE